MGRKTVLLSGLLALAAVSSDIAHAQSQADANLRWLELQEIARGSQSLVSPAQENELLGKVRELLDIGADPNAPDGYGRTAVHYAAGATASRGRVLALLLSRGGHCCRYDRHGDTPLHYVVARFRREVIAEAPLPGGARDFPFRVGELLWSGADPDARNAGGYSPLHYLASENDLSPSGVELEILDVLLQAGADPNLKAGDGNTPLHIAAAGMIEFGDGHGYDVFTLGFLAAQDIAPLGFLDALLKAGADPNVSNARGQVPLQLLFLASPSASSDDDAKLRAATMLVQAHADPEVEVGGETPLFLALEFDYPSTLVEQTVSFIRALARAGANLDRRDSSGDTALHVAIRNGLDESIVEALLVGGADPCIRSAKEGFVPYQLARGDGNQSLMRLLERAGGYVLGGEDEYCKSPAAREEESLALDRDDRRRIQSCLKAQGFDPGPADGLFGRRTRVAIAAWQGARTPSTAAATGFLTRAHVDALLSACTIAVHPVCSGTLNEPACWIEVEGKSGCYMWNPNPQVDETVTWSGRCVDGKASGKGRYVWRSRSDDGWKTSWGEGLMVEGRERRGFWVEGLSDGSTWEGFVVDGRNEGRWVQRETGGRTWDCWASGERVGEPDAPGPCALASMDQSQSMEAVALTPLRSGPAVEYERIGFLEVKDKVRAIGRKDGWVWVEMSDGSQGFVQEALLVEASSFAVGEVFRDCEECPEMVVVPPGEFMMGSPRSERGRFDNEGPMHRVRIERPFAVGVYEVTFAEWDACESGGGCGGYRPDDGGWGRGRRPVIGVSWEDAQSYVRWLSEKTGEAYRLPSESEWEYVARAGTGTPFHTGETISTGQANYDGIRQGTVAVGSFEANGFGLHDVHGNVWEWVGDCWNDSYRGAPEDGSAWESGDCSRRVLRGGSWFNWPRFLRSAYRHWYGPGVRFNTAGFRIARTLTP